MFDHPNRSSSRKSEASPVERLALFIFSHAGSEPVRTMEAIGAVVANQLAQALAKEGPGGTLPDPARREQAFLCHLELLDVGLDERPPDTDARFATCLRIARRAIAGALRDPTDGATRFHPIGATPGWSQTWLPTAWIGGFLFYREEKG